MAAGPRRFAYVTLLTRNSYLPGLLVLWFSLREVESRYPLVVMVTHTLPLDARDLLRKVDIRMIEAEPVRPAFEHYLATSDFRFADTWTKLRGFELVEFDRIVLLDCDMVVRRNMDDLFTLALSRDEIAAVHVCACNPYDIKHYPKDWIPQNCAHSATSTPTSPPPKVAEEPRPCQQLNSGTLVVQPSHQLFQTVCRVLQDETAVRTFTFPDQDLLATAFHGKWIPLPCYGTEEEVRCIHYILADKPWRARTPPRQEFVKTHGWWWDMFDRMVSALEDVDPEAARWTRTQVDKGGKV
ncbi:nucleotide-diphospho-sugar transferase [Coprinellus micaceus]|uniref:Nucleotide-diphospho-sugar transferase n=1 Tax=Coprinellus micaceus TaxID=71717 RepID=A0A4Y7TYK4_COPMI|nr:nucleotide-diphospho-sugar transferase [Coprinellus micaceus]